MEAKETLTLNDESIVFVELYNFHLKNGDVYFAACNIDIPFDNKIYLAFPIERSQIKSTVDNKIDNTEIKVSNVDDVFTSALFQGYDFRGCMVDIIQIIYPDSLQDSSLFRWVFSGYMDTPVLNEKEKIFKVTLKANLPNLQVGRISMLSCNSEFADQINCFANKDLCAGTVQSGSDQNTIYIQQNRVDNYWRNGHITINYETRKIKSNVGNKIITEYPFSFKPNGSTYTIERHCDKSFKNCKEFGQGQNFAGFPAIPFEQVIKT